MIEEQVFNRDIQMIVINNLNELDEDRSECTFFCGDFQSSYYKELTKNQSADDAGSAHLIVGPAVLRHRLGTNQEMMTLRPCRPLYCELMKSVTMKLCSEVTNKRELVELVHFMGGSVRKDSTSNLDIPTLRPAWIHECWKFRDDPNFDVFNKDLIEKHRLKVFEGLHIYFHGFKSEEAVDMLENLKESGAILTFEPNKATHVVYNSAPNDFPPLEPLPNQYHVTQEWYWVSLHRGSCAVEENFALPTMSLRKKHFDASETMNSPIASNLTRSHRAHSKSASSMLDCSGEGLSLNATPDYIYSNEDVEKAVKSPKVTSPRRLQICVEMFDTENNYVKVLKLLLKFRDALEEEIQHNEFIKKSDVAMIFGKLEPIVELHEKIIENMRDMYTEGKAALLANAKDEEKKWDFAGVWLEMREELKRVYPPYLNSYDTARSLFDTLDKENSKFHTFCKAKECNPEYHRLKINDMMVKPVQRLPSVLLLFREMSKKTTSHRVKNNTDEATRLLDDVLKIANRTRERNDHLITHMSKFTDIENVPPHLVAANRMFIRELVVMPIASTAPRLHQFYRMKLFLFHDVMLITKIRSEKNTMQRLARHASFASLHSRTRRPYKYIEQIPLSAMRSAVRIRPSDEFMSATENLQNVHIPYVWCLIHRDDQGGDTETVFESMDDEAIRDFLDDIHIKIMTNYGRFFLSPEPATTSSLDETVADLTMRHFRRSMLGHAVPANTTMSERTPRNGAEWSHNLNDTINVPPQPQQSKMRRAFSNAQLTLASTFGFGRYSSRNNLGQINENSSMMASPRVSCDPAALANMTSVERMPRQDSERDTSTPKRGLRARLTSSTFLNRTLNRNTSLRRQTINPDKEGFRSRTTSQITEL
ncbi:unnamed protein product [Caenorhabditis bovis]|uniref:DH domain-containing protein n=1 Tax=Caenorhabditis bovis TaxID=2654633 RepID=A0A8S1ETJ2_9PELO|nr:unnamed protein product [Caenorhabditis bovis]